MTDEELITQWQNTPYPLSDEGYQAMLEEFKSDSKVTSPSSKESGLYGCDESYFTERVASKAAINNRRLLYGVGNNDAWYAVTYKTKCGKQTRCPYYSKWSNMLKRCYNSKSLEARPTYKEVTVSKDWHLFSNFRLWMEKQDWQGKVLDKDILVLDNKVYSAATCIFVSVPINNLLTNHGTAQGDHPQGVSWNDSKGKYQAHCSFEGRREGLGSFTKLEDAEASYNKRKYTIVAAAAHGEEAMSDIRLHKALVRESLVFRDRVFELTKEVI